MKVQTCPHCFGTHHAHGARKNHSCPHCGGSWASALASGARALASNPMVQQLASSALQRYAPGVASHVNRAVGAYNTVNAHPLGNMAVSAARRHVGLGRRRRVHPTHGAMLPLGQMSPGESAYAQMRASGRHHRRGGKGGLPGGMGVATQALGMIPGVADALGPFGALLGIEPPPPPPPHATFSAVRAGPSESARAHGIGRGKHSRVHHACPHCGGAKHSAPHVVKHKCSKCGGSWASALASGARALASNPMVQQLASSALQRYAPGVASHVNRAVGAYHAVNAHPLGNMAVSAARRHVGLGRRTRAPTAHSLAVKHVMASTGMGLGHASRYVKENGLARHH